MISCHLGSSSRTREFVNNFFEKSMRSEIRPVNTDSFSHASITWNFPFFRRGFRVKSLYVNHSKYTMIWYLKVICKKLYIYIFDFNLSLNNSHPFLYLKFCTEIFLRQLCMSESLWSQFKTLPLQLVPRTRDQSKVI